MRAKTWAPLVTFVAVAAAGTTVALVHDRPAGVHAPKNLRLAATAALGAPVSAGAGSESGYELDTTLSDVKPADQRAYALSQGSADRELVAQLAAALHVGRPARDSQGWHAGGLTVSDRAGQPWTWSNCTPPTPSAPDGATAASGCAVSGVAVQPGATPPPDLPRDEVTAAVRDVFAALHLDLASARIDTSPYGGGVTSTTPGVVGLDTTVSVDGHGVLSQASGWLGTRIPADSYPVVSAKDAYADLPALVHPDICQLAPGGKGGCLPPEPVRITGAELGLSVQSTTDGGSVLVPSWLFTTRSSGVVAVVAVEKQYRSQQEPPRDLPATAGPGTVMPGSVEPAPPAPQAKPSP